MNAREAAVKTLVRIMDEQAFSNLEISNVLDKNKVDQRGRGLYVNLVYGTLQHLYTIDYVLKQFVKRDFNRQKPLILWDLRVAVYQILYLDNLNDKAIVGNAVEIAKRIDSKIGSFVNGVLRNIIRNRDRLKEEIKTIPLETKLSVPDWIIEKYRDTYGDGATRLNKFSL